MTAGIRARLEQLEESHLEPDSGDLLVVLAWLVRERVEIPEEDTNAARRRAMFVLAAGGEAAAPVGRLAKAALDRGLYLMTHWNVAMVCPPLTITPDEFEEGLAILDDVLALADEHYTG